jgi:ATP/maltotriose-dependent transcriptional regulator MalT
VIWLYWLWALLADPISGERELQWATELLARIGDRSHFSSTAAVLARATYALGRYDDAERLTREAQSASRANDVHGQITWRSTRAKILARKGELAAAEAIAREAIAYAERSDFLTAHGDALMDFADVLVVAERGAEAVPCVQTAVELYERKVNVVAAANARALLLELPSDGG